MVAWSSVKICVSLAGAKPGRILNITSVLFLALCSAREILIFKCTEGAGVGDYSSWGGGGEKNRWTVITPLQLPFTERVVPATQAFDWSLDNRC